MLAFTIQYNSLVYYLSPSSTEAFLEMHRHFSEKHGQYKQMPENQNYHPVLTVMVTSRNSGRACKIETCCGGQMEGSIS